MIGLGRLSAAVLLGSVALGGCARLTVQVDVMDPVYAKQAARDAEMRIEGQRLAEGNYRTTRTLVARQFATYRSFRANCLTDAATAYEEIAGGMTATDAATQGQRQASVALAQTYRTAIADPAMLAAIAAQEKAWLDRLIVADRNAGAAVAASGGILPQKAPVSDVVQRTWLARNEAIAELETYLRGEVGQWHAICGTAAENAAGALGQRGQAIKAKVEAEKGATEAQMAAATRQSITGGGILLNDRLEAFYVTDAPKEAWAESYNRAFGEGIGGSTSIAVVMNETADFSIKGFVFDGRSTADMIGKVAVQAVTLLAASQGLPVGTKAASGSDPAAYTSDATKLVADTQSKQYAAEASEAAYRAFLFRMADTILADMGALTTAGDGGNPARQRVKDTFDAHKDSWKLPETK